MSLNSINRQIFLKVMQGIYCYKGPENLKPSGHFSTKRVNILGFYFVSTQSTCVFCVEFVVRKTAIISLCNISNWFL
jgi:hypothetical protein